MFFLNHPLSCHQRDDIPHRLPPIKKKRTDNPGGSGLSVHMHGGGDPAGIQTQDLQNRNLTLYSAKLPGQCGCKITEKERIPKEKCGKTHTQALRNSVFEGIRRTRSTAHRVLFAGKTTFSLSQMSNDELAQSLPWRENVG